MGSCDLKESRVVNQPLQKMTGLRSYQSPMMGNRSSSCSKKPCAGVFSMSARL